ncbi:MULTISPECIES: HD domain-containing protein [unclassified Candidatus Tisiphia]|uniref:HD domain-containing protein n=1 Tax=unclassified Candidatus Tisiphia TaxID=2996318 RepID=UPI00312C73C7
MEDSNTLEYAWEERYTNCQYAEKLLNRLSELNKQVTHPVDINEIQKGIYYAKKYHGSQIRQSGDPYYSHPIEVAYMVAEYTTLEMSQYFRTDMIITSLLHDTLEDTDLSEKMIFMVFGEQIASQVVDLTRVKTYGKISAAETLNILFQQKKYDILLIKLFDRLHNMQTISAKSPDKIQKIIRETLREFIVVAMYLGMPKVEQEFKRICLQKKVILPNFMSVEQIFNYEHNSQLASPIL